MLFAREVKTRKRPAVVIMKENTLTAPCLLVCLLLASACAEHDNIQLVATDKQYSELVRASYQCEKEARQAYQVRINDDSRRFFVLCMETKGFYSVKSGAVIISLQEQIKNKLEGLS